MEQLGVITPSVSTHMDIKVIHSLQRGKTSEIKICSIYYIHNYYQRNNVMQGCLAQTHSGAKFNTFQSNMGVYLKINK